MIGAFTAYLFPEPKIDFEGDLQRIIAGTLRPIVEHTDEMKPAFADLEKAVNELPDSPQKTRIREAPAKIVPNVVFIDLYAKRRSESQEEPKKGSSLLDPFVSSAHAQPAQPAKFSVEDARPYALLIIMVVLGITFVGSIVVIFFTKNAEVLKFAFDTMKTLLGFFIGVATSFFGATH